ncbi:uncharacterized protein LOC132509246 [Lagenorhynchus albirostris]|uniref:uncharacterized protein LOC132509246 n=1 Tax=Lagenorhynchus albirostris TaxID=27610 RepID=UPI0028E72247|nr:uncharacterized protein LOC132509246 [Lagenorhynchus albirostris]
MPSPGAGRGLFEQQGPPACKLSLYLVPQTVISSARQPWSRAVSPACVGATGGGGQGHAVRLNLTPRRLEGSLQGQLRGRRGRAPETTRWDGRARGEVTQLRLPWPEHPSFHSIEPPGAGSQIPGSGVWTGPGGDAQSPPRDVLRLSLWPPRMGDSSWLPGSPGLWGHCKARSSLAPRGMPVRHQLTQFVPLGTPAPTPRGAVPGEGQMDPPLPEAPAPPLACLDTGQNLNTQGLARVQEMRIFHFSPNWKTAELSNCSRASVPHSSSEPPACWGWVGLAKATVPPASGGLGVCVLTPGGASLPPTSAHICSSGLPLQRDPAFQPLLPSWTKPGRLAPGWASLLPGTAHAQRLWDAGTELGDVELRRAVD